MRPIRLELKGFTAYRESQVLEFEDLDLFAITGPTGSGKSSLLDAMTYALYGKVERVGNVATLLISQGQPRLSVMLDFDVDGRRYRVIRTTGQKAQRATVRLERWVDGDWQSYGEGADRIKETTRIITGLVGLDYPAFTRSVLLPQGRFSEFLTGDAAERRDILTELLDLGLYERMARLAGETARSAKAAAEANANVVDTQFAGVDAKAVKEARRAARDAEARSEAIAKVERGLEDMAKRWRSECARIEALAELAGEAEDVGRAAEEAAEGLEGMAGDLKAARAAAQAAAEAARRASTAAAEAEKALAEGEARLGTAETLAAAGAALEELSRVEARIEAAERRSSSAAGLLEARRAASVSAREAVAQAEAELARVVAERTETERELEEARHADLVAAAASGLSEGDPCPVCGKPLDEVPRADTKALRKAERAQEFAQRGVERAETTWAAADRESYGAEAAQSAAENDAARALTEVERCRAERDMLVPGVAAAFGGTLPLDPAGELKARADELQRRREATDESVTTARAAERDSAEASERARDVAGRSVELVARVRGLPVPRLVERARRAVPALEAPPGLTEAVPADPGQAAAASRAWAEGCAKLSAMLRGEADAVRSGLDALLDQARASLPGGIPVALVTDVEELLVAVRALNRDLVAQATGVAKDAERLGERLAERTALERDVETRSREAMLYQALAGELRADRLIGFLQGEALELLAAAGSERLLFLSQGRYRLLFEGDEFYVEDRQNGDERRSVRTLSGGETFLASLALALALSEQIRSLAVTERARLESLFIDEGFGALDAESLEIATEALGQLGGQDRLVGVITHVSELAERLPVRIEVEKLPTGSRLRVVS